MAGRAVRQPSLADAIVPMVALVVLIGGSLALFGLDALDGPVQEALILSAMVAALIAMKNGNGSRSRASSSHSPV
jgi:NhaC family Na+:H+ antiporter